MVTHTPEPSSKTKEKALDFTSGKMVVLTKDNGAEIG